MTKPKKNVTEKLVGFEEIADMTGMSIPFLRKAQYRMGLPHYKLGGRIKFKVSEIESWLNERAVAG